MAGIFAVTDFAELGAQNATVAAIQGALTGASAATAAAASVLGPAGGDGASIRALAQQHVSIEQFAAMFTQGMLALQERVAATESFSGVSQAAQAAQAAALSVL